MTTPLSFPLQKPDCVESANHVLACQFVLEHIIAAGIPGDIAEFGVHAGDNLVPMAHLLKYRHCDHKHIYAFDTFAGLPFSENPDNGGLKQGECCTPFNVLWGRLTDEGVSDSIIPVKGMVEETLPNNYKTRLAFAFIDLDLESSCRVALDWITDRMPHGAIFGIHDYGHPRIPGPEKICKELEATSDKWERWGPIFGNACFFERK